MLDNEVRPESYFTERNGGLFGRGAEPLLLEMIDEAVFVQGEQSAVDRKTKRMSNGYMDYWLHVNLRATNNERRELRQVAAS